MHHRGIYFTVLVVLILLVSLAVGVGRAAAVSFAPKADFPAGVSPYKVAVGDFNGDGKQDLAASNFTANTVSVLLGNGAGSFGARTDFATGSGPYPIVAADFNADGKLDLATADYNANTVSVLLGNGDGTFATKVYFATGSGPFSMTVGDFNGDGKWDLATGNYVAGGASVLLGNGSGGFAAKTDYATGAQPRSIAAGDFNGDGNQDLAVTNNSVHTVSVLLADGSGGFGAKTDFTTGAGPDGVTVGDFNGDGKRDLAVANNSGTASVLLGTGGGAFAARTDFTTGSSSNGVAVGDFNGDGNQDLAASNFTANTVSVLLGNGSGALGAKTDFATGAAPFSVAVGDFNGDGRPDLTTANYNANSASVLLNITPAAKMAIDADAVGTNDRIATIDTSAPLDVTELRLRNAGGVWSAWQTYAAQTYWTLSPGEGTKTVEVQYRNAVDQSLVYSDTILLDTTAPTTTDNAPAVWQNVSDVPVHVTFSADDGAGSGVATTQYKVDGATTWTAGSSVDLSSGGAHTVKYRSIDVAGNVEETQYATVKIDVQAPDIALLGIDDAWHAGPVMAYVQASDALSGVLGAFYNLDGTGVVWAPAVLVTAEGDHTFDWGAADNAGNTTATQHAHIRIDTHKPTTSGLAASVKRNKKATFKIKVADPLPCSATDATVTIKIKNARGKVVATLSGFGPVATNVTVPLSWAKCTLARGTYRYKVYATDAAGNVQAKAGGNKLVVK